MLSLPIAILFGLFAAVAKAGQYQHPFWIIAHSPLVSTRIDNIVSPGGISGHQHAVVGASTFGPQVDYDAAQKAECVSGLVSIDHSSYWAPELYRKTADGFKMQGLSYANTYYFSDRREGTMPIYEFPPGFRMLAGDPNRTSLNVTDQAQDAIRYVCLGGSSPEGHEFPKEQCPMGLRAEAFFPSCWDGVHNWLEGSKHMAYSLGVYDGSDSAPCPATHPKKLPQIFYEFIYHDDDPYEEGARVWATGDDVGYSFHADFVNGWPEGKISEIISYGTDCGVQFSLENCPALKPYLQDRGKCTYNGTVVDEDIGDVTPIAKLPGNNPVWGSSGPKVLAQGFVENKQFMKKGMNGSDFQPEGPGKEYAEIAAGNLHIVTIPGDPAYTGATSIAQAGATGGVDNTAPTVTQSSGTASVTGTIMSSGMASMSGMTGMTGMTDMTIATSSASASQASQSAQMGMGSSSSSSSDGGMNAATTGVSQSLDSASSSMITSTSDMGNNLAARPTLSSSSAMDSSSSMTEKASHTGSCHAKKSKRDRRSRAHL